MPQTSIRGFANVDGRSAVVSEGEAGDAGVSTRYRQARPVAGDRFAATIAAGREIARMLSHVHVGITDYQRAFAFYSAIMNELDLELRFEDPERGWAAWMQRGVARPLFVIGRPYDGEPADPGNGNMIALLASARTRVDRCHALALRIGGVDEGLPGLRPWYHPHYYGAYFRDPDGNKLCVCCHEAGLTHGSAS